MISIIINFADSGEELDLAADLCVVGTGAAGLTIAHELRRSGLRMCLIETGGFEPDPANEALNQVEIDDSPPLDLVDTRPRIFGGSTAEWGGMCCPLDACDFSTRPGMPLHGWPVSLDQLTPYYQRAHAALGLGPQYFDERLWSVLGIPPPLVDQTRLRTKFWQYRSPGLLPPDSPLRFGPAYRDDFRSGSPATVVLGATVSRLIRVPGEQRPEQVEFRSIAGRRGRVRARAFVLANGAIESARLLLDSDFAGCSQALGRYFMEHPHLTVGRLSASDTHRVLPKWVVLQRSRGVAFRPKLLPAPVFQLERDILNASLTLEVRCPPECPHRAAADLARQIREHRPASELLLGARGAARNSAVLAGAAYRRVRGRQACPAHNGIGLYVRSEQEPNPESRVVLGPDRDAVGVRRAVLRWRLTDRDRRTVTEFADVVGTELRRLGAGELRTADWLAEPGGWPADMQGGPHHSGTTRMSSTPATGVVNRDSRVHGVPNLYVVGPSVFPTGGYANPAYTVVALAIRAADHLLAQLTGRAPELKHQAAHH